MNFLQVELTRISGDFPTDRLCESDYPDATDYPNELDLSESSSTVTCRVSIVQVATFESTSFR